MKRWRWSHSPCLAARPQTIVCDLSTTAPPKKTSDVCSVSCVDYVGVGDLLVPEWVKGAFLRGWETWTAVDLYVVMRWELITRVQLIVVS